jgi:predicted RNA-binding protein
MAATFAVGEDRVSEINQVAVEDRWLTLAQSADLAQTCVATLRRRIRQGRLRAATIAVGDRKIYRVRQSWLNAMLEASAEPVEIRR